jgi:hypothetical protein
MRRTRRKSAWQGRLALTLVAAAIGYLIGNWNAQAVRGVQAPSAAQAIALRFPENMNIAEATPEPASHPDAPAGAAMMLGPTELALFDPEPMVPHPEMTPPLAEPAAAEPAEPLPPPPAAAPAAAAPPAKPAQLAGIPKPHPVSHLANRPGIMLDDAQIASIKQRLHLTPEQEEMWPAVEAALRNVAFARVHEAHRRGARPGALDPNSTEVQDLKSAAIPLLMSFSSEQKDEVRSMAHVMGLDQLASQF